METLTTGDILTCPLPYNINSVGRAGLEPATARI